ncbi:MAG: SLC26A/SulP transporter family protein [Desulfobacterales bacterium]|nr:SLC26A/SulP transporter family protein [Desulfobacterales bacterium]
MESHAKARPNEIRLVSWLKEEFQPTRLIPNLVSGAVTAVLTIIESVSYAALIFSGAMAAHISTGIAVTLTAAAVAGLVMSMTSSYPGTIAVPQNKIAPILALIAAAIAATMPEGASDQQTLLTVIAAVVVSSVAAGLFMTALGTFGLGGLIRFIPYPVIAGFLAGTGWLLLLGSIKAMTGTAVTVSSLPGLFETSVFIKWLPGLLFAVTAFILMGRVKHFLVMPALLTAAVILFYAVLLLTGTSVHEAREAGWLIHTGSGGGLWKFLTVKSLLQANWSVIFQQAGSIASILLISAVAVLLNSSALELSSKQDLDLDRELKSAGMANIATGLAGGMIGFTSLTITGLGLKMGVKSRLVGLITVAACLAVLFLGAGVLSFFPEPIIGGLLMFLGMEFLSEWVFSTRHELPFSDWIIVLVILSVVGLFGFLHGVMIGIIAAIIMFVLNYSRINVVKHELAGTHHHSNVDRQPRQQKILQSRGDQVYILKLHGYIFFGTANTLLNQVRQRVTDEGLGPLRFALLDFREVSGIDSSAVISLIKMNQLAAKSDFKMIFTHLPDTIRMQMGKGKLCELDDQGCLDFPDIDHGIEWCEDQILESEGLGQTIEGLTLADYLEELVPGVLDYAKLEKYLERVEVPEDHHLLRQGDLSEDLFFIESGQVSVRIEVAGGEILRLRKMGAGTVVGELGLYLNQARTASVVTREPSVVYRLTRKSLETMEEKNPQTAAVFHRFMVRFLAQRLINTDNTLKTLLE